MRFTIPVGSRILVLLPIVTLAASQTLAVAFAGPGGARMIFVSAPASPAFVGGLTGADLVCRESAERAGLDGVYLAWLGDGILGPADRFERGPAAFVNVRGEQLAAGWADLTDGALAAAILALDGSSPAVAPWSNVNADGTTRSLATACSRWWAASPSARGAVDRLWTPPARSRGATAPCDTARPFYCVEQ